MLASRKCVRLMRHQWHIVLSFLASLGRAVKFPGKHEAIHRQTLANNTKLSMWPSLREMRQRAQPWSHHLSIKPGPRGVPGSFMLYGLLTTKEVEELVAVAREGFGKHQEPRSKFHATVSLDKVPSLNASKPVQALNARLSVLAGLPDTHIEEGYFSLYTAGHELSGVHLDNHHALFSPLRSVSVVLYLVGAEQGLRGGGTVFPLASSDLTEDELSRSDIKLWDAQINQSSLSFKMGQDPQIGRVCPQRNTEACPQVLARAASLCAAEDEHSVVPPKEGNAILFYNLGGGAGLTAMARAIHGSCGVPQGTKVVLAKFLRTKHRPWVDENVFTQALQAARQTPRDSGSGSQIESRSSGWKFDHRSLDEL